MSDTTVKLGAIQKRVPTKAKTEINRPDEDYKKALYLRDEYINKNLIMGSFDDVPTYMRLMICQTLPNEWFESRSVGGKSIDYLPYDKAQKLLNIVFNFNVDCEIIKDSGADGVLGGKKFFEVTMQVKFTCKTLEGQAIVRNVYSGHKQYPNAAISKADCYKAALSKAYTVVSRTLGIGSSKGTKEDNINVSIQEEKVYEAAQEPQQPPANQDATKSFSENLNPNF